MFFLYSKGCEYAVRALTVAAGEGELRFQVKDICRKARVPHHYARKAIERLASEGILEAIRGRGGGYRFRVEPRKISILQLITAIDGEESLDRCVMGLAECGERRPCPLHETWLKLKMKYLQELGKKTLADIAKIGAGKFDKSFQSETNRSAGEGPRRKK